MCIRDRLDHVVLVRRVVLGEHQCQFEHVLAEHRHPRSTVAVSYTHLRAHETVLDLVCRLLLEKKTTNIIPYHTHHIVNNAI
mgnify:CR=1 FL=1